MLDRLIVLLLLIQCTVIEACKAKKGHDYWTGTAVQSQCTPENYGYPDCPIAIPQCPLTLKYRTYDGSCNNLANPIWGTPHTPFNRLLPPNYADGMSKPTIARSGRPLPPSRVVSYMFSSEIPIEDLRLTLAAMQYGQVITHDLSHIAGNYAQLQYMSELCCTGSLIYLPKPCFPIYIAADDPGYYGTNVSCLNFVRTFTDKDGGLNSGSRPVEQLSAVNHYLDLSIVYGNSDITNHQVREYQGGRLKREIRNGQEWLPQNPNPFPVCRQDNPNDHCYLAGDVRVNKNPQFALMQTVFLREHNRIANYLAILNPQWDDETLFEEARKIVIAEHQHISYYEWLPYFLGLDSLLRLNIIYNARGFINDYRPDVNPSVLNDHTTGAFRYYHTLVPGHANLVTEYRNISGYILLNDWLDRPTILEYGNSFDDLARGLTTQAEMRADEFYDVALTKFFHKNRKPVGHDLRAIDIQRARDHGLASYNDYRVFCGLPKARTFQDFSDLISQKNIEKLARLYEIPDDVDLSVGGALERHIPGTLAGPTFHCILTEQFYRTRVGDRYFFENGNPDTGFTLEQLREIRKSSIARLLCDNVVTIRAMQPRGFEKISEGNPLVLCEQLPMVNLGFWRNVRG